LHADRLWCALAPVQVPVTYAGEREMSKKECHREELTPLLDTVFETGECDTLLAYIASHSNLPGPRGNLELALAFADLCADACPQRGDRSAGREPQPLWALCAGMARTSPKQAPVNAPEELIPFCGALGIGAIGAVSPPLFHPALVALRRLANDPRWRMREAVCFGLQRLLAMQPQATLDTLAVWVAPGEWLEMRAAAAAVAEPALLKDERTASAALQLHRDIIDHLLAAEDRRAEPCRVLRKGLGYTLSVVVRALPEEGFALMAQLVVSGDPDALWIVKQNLKKKRLVRNFPQEVESLRRRFPD
jgi:hypothetical protein